MTRPGNAAWLTASPMNASPLSTTNVPMTAQTMPTRIAADEAALHEAVGHRVGDEADDVHHVGRPRGSGARRRPPGRGGGRRRGRARPPSPGRTRTWPPYVSARRCWSRTSSAGPVATIRPLTNAASWKRCAAQIRSWVVAMTVLPARASRLEDVHEVFLGRRVDAGHGLVEEVQLGLGGDRAGEEDPPALAARQRADLAIDLRRPCRRSRAPASTRSRSIGRAGRRPKPSRGVAAHHHHLPDGHREVPVDGLGLGHVGDPRAATPRLPAEHLDAARERLEQPGDDLEERALAGAVRADDRQQRSAPDIEVDVGEGDAARRSRR